jgi:UDP-N-acetylmuramyl pentapeptide phosphotransferase/UDP-N-acetylglucosamine-1-phosphate transferase
MAVAGGVLAASGALTLLGAGALIPLLRRGGILDRPNRRSLHTSPTPRGAGIAVVGTVLLAWLAAAASGQVGAAVVPVSLAAGPLAAVCWLDDLYGLAPALKLMAQAAAVAIGMSALPRPEFISQWTAAPALADIAVGLVWLWWVNIFNFMDGIDGLAGGEAAAIGGGLLLFAAVGVGVDPGLALLAAAVLGAALGFLRWNWSPARIFLGDVGSVLLGYLTGFLLIGLALAGHWRIALILPLYFLADATITLIRRLLRGERVWEAHRAHFYQQAVAQGRSHAAVAGRVVTADLLLVGCGWAAENGAGSWALVVAAVIVAGLIIGFTPGRR